MRLTRVKAGDVLWDVRGHRVGNTTMRTVSVYEVRVLEVRDGDGVGPEVWATWNGNAPRWYTEHDARRWRKTEPRTITTWCGAQRLETRADRRERVEREGER